MSDVCCLANMGGKKASSLPTTFAFQDSATLWKLSFDTEKKDLSKVQPQNSFTFHAPLLSLVNSSGLSLESRDFLEYLLTLQFQ